MQVWGLYTATAERNRKKEEWVESKQVQTQHQGPCLHSPQNLRTGRILLTLLVWESETVFYMHMHAFSPSSSFPNAIKDIYP